MNKKVNETRVSQFQSLQAVTSRAVTLDEVVRLIRHDSSVEGKTASYRKMMDVLGKEKADTEVKQRQMPAVSVAVLFDGTGRRAANMVALTGLALVDIDHLDGDGEVDEAFRRVAADPHTLLAYRTVGGHGLRVVYRYRRQADGDTLSASTWPAAFLKGNSYYALLTGHDYDQQCSDMTRLSGLAHDADVWVNWQAEPFTVSDDEVLEASFTTSRTAGRPRREYPAGTHQTALSDALPRVEQALERRGLAYAPGHRHDYVMHAAFLLNRYGVSLDDALAWADTACADYGGRAATVRSCYGRTDQHGTWRLNRTGRDDRQGRQGRETSMITLPKIRQWLNERVEVVYNMVTDISQWRYRTAKDRTAHGSATDGGTNDGWQQLDERTVCSMRTQMARDTGKRVLKSDVTDVLHSDFARLQHPVREYVEALPPWDGRDRVAELCSHVTPEAAQPGQSRDDARQLLQWMMHKWLAATVATWMSDNVTNHEIMVLIGPQGIYKTSFFRHLLPQQLRHYFWENAHNSFASKDEHLALAENCLVEIEEVDLQGQRDIAELKALATSDRVKERRPYARFPEEKHRLASFCASGNQQHFLCDDTGNRRWLCAKVSHIDDPRQWALDYTQLYAQLRDELAAGFRYWFNAGEQQRVEQQNRAFRMESDEEQLIRTRLRPPGPTDKVTLMNAATICQYVNGGIVGRGISTRKVSLVMGKLGFTKVHTMQGWFYKVFQIPANQIQSTLALTPDSLEESKQTPDDEENLPF